MEKINEEFSKINVDFCYNKLLQFHFQNRTLIDLGSGLGHWSFSAIRLNNKVTLVENRQNYIDFLKNKIHSENITNIKVIKSNLNDFISNEKFDFIILSNVIQYLDFEHTFSLLNNLSKSETKLYVSTHSFGYYIFKIFEGFKQLNIKIIVRYLIVIFRSILVEYKIVKYNGNETFIFKKTLINRLKLLNFNILKLNSGQHPIIGNRKFLNMELFYEMVLNHE